MTICSVLKAKNALLAYMVSYNKIWLWEKNWRFSIGWREPLTINDEVLILCALGALSSL